MMFTPADRERLFEDLATNVQGLCIQEKASTCGFFIPYEESHSKCYRGPLCSVACARAFSLVGAIRVDLADGWIPGIETENTLRDSLLTPGAPTKPRGLTRPEVTR